MRPKTIIANWKMHKNFEEGLQLATEVIKKLHKPRRITTQIILLAPFIHLEALSKLLPASENIRLGAQNCHEQALGAFTGEIAAPMLRSVGASAVLVGHSERRQHFCEGDARLAQKVTMALKHGLRPIFCCGESQQTRAAGQQEPFVNKQLAAGLFHLTGTQIAQAIIAYEPVWAIGTGNTPPPAQVQAIHKSIRSIIARKYGNQTAQGIPIVYGGSCNAQNASAFFACPDVDGGLIGKAALEAASFVAIVDSLT